ncbi:MAG TPA: hypothetical protein VFQ44_25220 [Streptosporangiaceae bacterium]|nr:hypothetical protein [Streptosporangiaceae bacterium]
MQGRRLLGEIVRAVLCLAGLMVSQGALRGPAFPSGHSSENVVERHVVGA